MPPPYNAGTLLLPEGLAVGAGIHSGVHLMGAHQDPVQGTVVLVLTVVGTLLDSTFDTLVCMTAHKKASFCFGFGYSLAHKREIILEKSSNVAFCAGLCYSKIKQCRGDHWSPVNLPITDSPDIVGNGMHLLPGDR